MKSRTAYLPVWLAALVSAGSPAPPSMPKAAASTGPAPTPDLSSCPDINFSGGGDGAQSQQSAPRYFSLVAQGAGGPTNIVGQIADGQNRIGGGVNMGQYYLLGGRIVDTHKRSCLLTPLVNQWQCDEGGIATSGFDISPKLMLTYNGNTAFWACPVNDHGEWNIYSQRIPDQKKCVTITLLVTERPIPGNCTFNAGSKPEGSPVTKAVAATKASTLQKSSINTAKTSPTPVVCPAGCVPSPAAKSTEPSKASQSKKPSKSEKTSQPEKSSKPKGGEEEEQPEEQDASEEQDDSEEQEAPEKEEAPEKPKKPKGGAQLGQQKEPGASKGLPKPHGTPKACPFDLKGDYEKPKLIVPVDQTRPERVVGSGQSGQMYPDVCSIFNFDVAKKHEGKQCSLNLFVPKGKFGLAAKKDAQTAGNSIEGNGNIFAFWLDHNVKANTTWSSKPKGFPLGQGPARVQPGEKVVLKQGPCPAGRKMGIQLCADENLGITFKQDAGKDPVGLFMRVC